MNVEKIMAMTDDQVKHVVINELHIADPSEGMDDLITWMLNNGFFESPCSGGNHLAVMGGLAKHSLIVFTVANEIAKNIDRWHHVSYKDVALAALLHDLGKTGDHGLSGYVPNILKNGEMSKSKPYERNKELKPIPHEQRSVMIAERFIELSPDVEWAISAHAGLYGEYKFAIPGHETPLYLILTTADMWASRVIEVIDNK